MKTEDLREQGLTQEQINFVMAENGKDLKAANAEKDSLQKKLDKSEASVESLKDQLKDAQETLKGFDGVDVEGFKKKISELEERAAKAEKDAEAKILQRDQRDYLNAEFDKLGITSERTRKSLMADIMGEDGLKWKDNSFLGLSDYLSKENEKDHFYKTDEEKQEEESKQKAAEDVPKFTDKSEPKQEPPKEDKKPVPRIW